jgi:Ino eighty subunit 2
MPRKRQISSTPEEVSQDEEDELSDVPSDVVLGPMEDEEGENEDVNEEEEDVDDEEGEDEEDEEEVEEEEEDQEEGEEEEDEEEEDDEAGEDDDYDQQSEEDRDVASSEDEEAESYVAVALAKATTSTPRGGRALRKQEPAPPQRAPYRSSRVSRIPPSDEEEEEDEEDEEEEEEEEDSDDVPSIPAITTTSKGRVSRKPAQLLNEMAINQPPSRPSRRAAAPPPPAPEPPKIKLRLNLGRDILQQGPMEEIKVESLPKPSKSAPAPKSKPETKPAGRANARGMKPPEIVVEPDEDEDEEESSSILEEDEEDMSEMMDDEDLPGGTEVDLDEEEEDDDDEELTERSRTGTPIDPTRMTKRQQAKYDEALRPHSLMSLPNGVPPPPPQTALETPKLTSSETLRKRALTAEEIALRRSETARRRKNQSEQRLEEEKIETINRLLKPQAPRRRGRAESPAAGVSDTELGTREPTPPPPPTKVRIVRDAAGTRVAVPERWMAAFTVAKPREVNPVEGCGRCGKEGIYRVKTGGRACSLGCIKALQAGV